MGIMVAIAFTAVLQSASASVGSSAGIVRDRKYQFCGRTSDPGEIPFVYSMHMPFYKAAPRPLIKQKRRAYATFRGVLP